MTIGNYSKIVSQVEKFCQLSNGVIGVKTSYLLPLGFKIVVLGAVLFEDNTFLFSCSYFLLAD